MTYNVFGGTLNPTLPTYGLRDVISKSDVHCMYIVCVHTRNVRSVVRLLRKTADVTTWSASVASSTSVGSVWARGNRTAHPGRFHCFTVVSSLLVGYLSTWVAFAHLFVCLSVCLSVCKYYSSVYKNAHIHKVPHVFRH